ncbi:MAG: DNA/RNA nuclease SfsA [Thermoplasmata archaeon]|nr:DNA/RNA nuclease SfsA [Thermoplasmata archaeon]
MRYQQPLVEAEFLDRENRFAAKVILDGKEERVHVPNTGRMKELLLPGANVLLLGSDSPDRRTRYDLVAVETPDVSVSVDSRVPNAVLSEALAAGAIPEFSDYDIVRPEYTWGSSRFDFLLENDDGKALVEVKGCTLVQDDGLALFPDAPTQRGARHVRELTRAATEGFDTYVVVIVQRSDGRVFAPNDRTDRAFGDAIREAQEAGVRVMAYGTRVTREGVDLEGPLDVDLMAALEVVS